jgi:NADPH:quinone reductase-like Zn-dependent oxidoreductase
MSALTALQGLRDKGQTQQGQSVLIVGASGGVGTFAVQIAKAYGAEVTGVCSGRNAEMVRSIGADHVVDYIQEDFARSGQRYDPILDMTGDRSLSDLRHALTPTGTLVMVGSSGLPSSGRLWFRGLYRWLRAVVWSLFVGQKLRAMLQTRSKEDLVVLTELIEAGKVTLFISASFPLSEAPEAIQQLDAGHAQGKVAIVI